MSAHRRPPIWWLSILLAFVVPCAAPAACRRDCKVARGECTTDVRATLDAAKQACATASDKRACKAAARKAAKQSRTACRDASKRCRTCCRNSGTACVPTTSTSASTSVTTSSTTTSTLAICGDGVRQSPERCDDGNADPADGCGPACSPTPCPTGIRDPHDGCDVTGAACDDLAPTCAAIDTACTLTAAEIESTIAYLADDAQGGRNNLTPESVRVQDFLIERLQSFALPAGATGYRTSFTQGTNILALIPGADPSVTETVVIGAHYDHLGAFGTTVYNGATDNAGGVAAVLAVGRALARRPVPLARPVLLALWDAEEDGLVGSTAYVASPRVPIADTIAYVNLDIVGASTVQGFRREVFVVGADTSPQFPSLLAGIAGGDPLVAGVLSAVFGQGRSDYQPFLDAGVPTLFFSDTTGGCYHHPGDDLSIVHLGKALRTAWLAYRVVEVLAEGASRPTFSSAGILPTYDDTVTLRTAFERGLCNAAASGLTPADVTQVEAWIAQLDDIIAAGAGAFDDESGINVGLVALDAISLLSSLPCQAN